MFLKKFRLIDWPRAMAAQSVGYCVKALMLVGQMDRAMKLARLSNALWKGL